MSVLFVCCVYVDVFCYYAVCLSRCCDFVICIFFFKQKTAYEMRISDWSSDVCSSDLHRRGDAGEERGQEEDQHGQADDGRDRMTQRADDGACAPAQDEDRGGGGERGGGQVPAHRAAGARGGPQIGRASCRDRVCPYV